MSDLNRVDMWHDATCLTSDVLLQKESWIAVHNVYGRKRHELQYKICIAGTSHVRYWVKSHVIFRIAIHVSSCHTHYVLLFNSLSDAIHLIRYWVNHVSCCVTWIISVAANHISCSRYCTLQKRAAPDNAPYCTLSAVTYVNVWRDSVMTRKRVTSHVFFCLKGIMSHSECRDLCQRATWLLGYNQKNTAPCCILSDMNHVSCNKYCILHKYSCTRYFTNYSWTRYFTSSLRDMTHVDMWQRHDSCRHVTYSCTRCFTMLKSERHDSCRHVTRFLWDRSHVTCRHKSCYSGYSTVQYFFSKINKYCTVLYSE